MPNRTLALDVSASTLRAALVESTLRSQRVLGFYASPRDAHGDLAAELRTFVGTHDLRWDEVLSTLPGDAVTQRILTLPFRDRKRLDQTVPFELETHLPFELEDAVIDYQVLGDAPDGAAVVLAAATSKTAVRAHLEALSAAGMDPRIVDLAPLAALNVLRKGGAALPGTSTLVTVDGGTASVAVFRDGRLHGLRTVTHGMGTNGDGEALVRDVRWSLAALAGDDLDRVALWTGGGTAASPTTTALARALGTTPQGLDTLRVDGVPPTLRRDQSAFATPLGLALRDGAAGTAFGLDFRRGEFTYHREREAIWRHAARTAILAAAVIVLMIVSYAYESSRLAQRRDTVRAQIRSLFTAALPEVRTIVNERAQLATEIAGLEKQQRL